jgi:hypothetical protein
MNQCGRAVGYLLAEVAGAETVADRASGGHRVLRHEIGLVQRPPIEIGRDLHHVQAVEHVDKVGFAGVRRQLAEGTDRLGVADRDVSGLDVDDQAFEEIEVDRQVALDRPVVVAEHGEPRHAQPGGCERCPTALSSPLPGCGNPQISL